MIFEVAYASKIRKAECVTFIDCKISRAGRIEGVMLRGRIWLISADVKKPDSPRRARKKIIVRIRKDNEVI